MRLKNPRTSGGLDKYRTNQLLIGTKNGINKNFKTPEKFLLEIGILEPRVEINGKNAYHGRQIKEYLESAGPNTGYDTIIFKVAPRKQDELRATYYVKT